MADHAPAFNTSLHHLDDKIEGHRQQSDHHDPCLFGRDVGPAYWEYRGVPTTYLGGTNASLGLSAGWAERTPEDMLQDSSDDARFSGSVAERGWTGPQRLKRRCRR